MKDRRTGTGGSRKEGQAGDYRERKEEVERKDEGQEIIGRERRK
jgi:hypothetical protein